MSRPAASALPRVIIGALGVAVVGASSALVAELASGTEVTTYGSGSTSLAVLEVTVGVALLVAALLLLSDRSTGFLGAVAAAAAASWFAPVWVGWAEGPGLVRGLGLVAAPLLPTVVLAVAIAVPPTAAGIRRIARFAPVAVVGLALTATALALALVRDPIRDLYCWRDCTAHAFLVYDDPALARRLMSIVLVLGAACGVAAALVAALRLARASAVTRRWTGPALLAAALAGIALAAYGLSLVSDPREAPDRPLYEWLFVSRAVALLGLAGALAWIALRPRLVRGHVTRLAVDLERSAAEGGLGRILADALRDPGLNLGYPIGSVERIVDAEGRPLALDPFRRLVPVVGEDGVIAFVESDVTTVDALERELGPAAHLALGNERLRAEALARLAELTESRARIVDSADRARRRMERDLHDGAQQRMLALGFDLQVAATVAESSGNERAAAPLRKALDRVVDAGEELRDVAHGIFPAELSVSGLGPALDSLSDLRALRLVVQLPAGRRYPPDIEIAAYAVVVEALDASEGIVTAVVGERDGRLRLTIAGIPDWSDRLVRVEDRVSAAGGEVSIVEGRLEVELPHE